MLIYLPGYLIHKNYHTNYSLWVCNRMEKMKKVSHKVENKTMETHNVVLERSSQTFPRWKHTKLWNLCCDVLPQSHTTATFVLQGLFYITHYFLGHSNFLDKSSLLLRTFTRGISRSKEMVHGKILACFSAITRNMQIKTNTLFVQPM